MASSFSSHKRNVEYLAFSGIEPDTKRRKISESSRLFDVFINHRGPDAKETLAVPLYNSLQDLGLRAFLDREEKEIGEYFPSTIETAIRSASAHIAIFSESYAESAWCLAELDLMLQSGAKIFPIYYGVKPSELRYIQSGAYADAFTKYIEKGRHSPKLETWEKALQSASLVTGLEINSANSFRDSQDFKNLVLDVKKEVERTKPLFVAQHPVALHKLVKEFESQCLDKLVHDFEKQCGLSRQGNDSTKIVGIFGMGGAGKTTLAKELFNRKRSNYMATCFLFDVREKSSRYGLPSLQTELIRELFPGSPSEFRSTEEGINYIRDCLRRGRFLSFLIVVDDIDHVKQLDALCLMEMADSLVIVTTRDVGVLTSAKITNRYNLKGLNRDDGRELFCWHSLNQPHPASGYENIVDAFVDVCGGLPLSLQVLGRHVYDRPVSYWELQLDEVRRSLDPDIKAILKISFDALNRVEKQIFMDIACFFVDKSKNTAIRVWEGSGWGAHYALETLKDRCLIEEGEGLDGLMWEDKPVVFKLHDHLRDLGREMSNDLCFPPRHWSPKHHKSLETRGFQNIITQTKGRCFHSIYDESMDSQITFFMGESEEVETSSSLLWLQLDLNSGNLSSIPPWIPLQNLQCLRVRHGYLKTLWQSNVQAPFQLKELQMYQTTLMEFPDFSGKSNNLERVMLDANDLPIEGWSLLASLRVHPRGLVLACYKIHGELTCNNRGDKSTFESSRSTSLVIQNFHLQSDVLSLYNVGESPALKCVLSNLESLEIKNQILTTKILICGSYCPSLLSLKIHDMESLIEITLLEIKTLNCLEIRRCKSLKRLSEMSNFRNLLAFKISECLGIEELSFHFTCIEKIAIKNCGQLKIVSGLSNINKLVEIDIFHCPVEELCFVDVSSLKEIRVGGCGKLKCLELNSCTQEIEIYDCERLQNILLPTTVNNLSVRNCRDLQRVSTTGEYMKITKKLSISFCPVLEGLPMFPTQSCTEEFWICECERLQNIQLPTTVSSLDIEGCRDLQRVSTTGEFMKITKKLTIKFCPVLEELPMFPTESCTEEIKICECEKLQHIPLPTTVSSLYIESCRDLQRVSTTGDFMKIQRLSIRDCEELLMFPTQSCTKCILIDRCERLQNIQLPTTVSILHIESCRDLQRVSTTGDFMKITKQLFISDCPVLEELPMFPTESCTEEIKICECEKLQHIPLPTAVGSLYIRNCRDLQRVSTTGEFMKFTETLFIWSCPVLEELPRWCRSTKIKGKNYGVHDKLMF